MSLPAPDPSAAVLVTGASSGIGDQLARQLAAHGHGLVLVARRQERLDALADELRRRHGVRIDVRAADLSDATARGELTAALHAGDRAIAGLCNNAGFGTVGAFAQLPAEREAEQVQLNVAALHELTGAFLPGMVERGEGAILNVASTAAFQPLPNMATYAATKAFVLSFSEALHAELAGTGVSCTALCPGPVPTEFGATAGWGKAEGRLPSAVYVTASDVAREAIDGMQRGRRTVVPGVQNRASALGGRLMPRSVLLPLLRRAGDRVR